VEIVLIKTINGWQAFDPPTEEWLGKKKPGAVIHSDFKQTRNPAFHRKGMSLLQLAFSYWEPGEINNQYGTVEKDFERFRKDITILAGFFTQSFRIDGSVRIEAKSLSFAKMDEEEFSRVYQGILTVILDKILSQFSEEEVVNMADQFWSYA
jgi:hypothetical protein